MEYELKTQEVDLTSTQTDLSKSTRVRVYNSSGGDLKIQRRDSEGNVISNVTVKGGEIINLIKEPDDLIDSNGTGSDVLAVGYSVS